jgi:hypothetical protein
MRRIFFKKIDEIIKQKKKLTPKSMEELGRTSNAANRDLTEIACNPRFPQVVASVSDSKVLIWNLEKPESPSETLNNYRPINSISWRHCEEKILATAS